MTLASKDRVTRLLACPFCGAQAQLANGMSDKAVWEHGHFSRVFCEGCQSRQLFHRTDEEAIAAWNTRPLHHGARREGMQAAFNEVADYLGQHGLKSYAALIRERSNGLDPGPSERMAEVIQLGGRL